LILAKKEKNIDITSFDRAKNWMESRGWKPQFFQEESWKALLAGHEGIVNAPTGSGKTYSLLLPFLTSCSAESSKTSGLQLLWITPIRALAKEIRLSAQRVIDELQLNMEVGIRSGDTSEEERASQKKKMPNILITTPESLHLLLARKEYPTTLRHLRLIVADEWHDLLGTKRGVMLELAIAHLKGVSPYLKIWGISATIGNLEEAMEALLGTDRFRNGMVIRSDIKKKIEVISILPDKVELMPWAGHLGIKMAAKVIPVIHKSSSTLLFTNVRSQCEIWYKILLEKDPGLAGVMAMHHGSISKEIRHWVEDALYEGRLKAVVCTSSLDLGVDFAPVETVVQIGGPKGVARFLQRAGRSGHQPGAASKIYFLPTHSLELIEAAALRQAISDEFLESRPPMTRCFDVLIQFMVTLSLGEGFDANELYSQIITTTCFESVTQEEWNWCIAFAASGGNSLGQYEDYNKLRLRDNRYFVSSFRIARKHRLAIGTIVSDTMMAIKFNRGGLIGHIEESFIASLNNGDHFWFAGLALELIRVKELTAFVKKTTKQNGKIPSWQGGKLPLSSRMSAMLRQKMSEAMEGNPMKDVELDVIQPLMKLQSERSRVPRKDELLIELFTSDDGYHAVFYPFEGRFVHEGLASLFAYRISLLYPVSFSLAYNDYGFELLSDQPIRLEEALGEALTDPDHLERDILNGVNATELAKRRFREIATISGLVFKGYPGQPIRDRHLQSSAQLIFQVFEDYDPQNLLLRQAYDEVVHYQLELPRLREALNRINGQKITILHPEKPTPFAFPIMVDRLREKMSSESLEQRIARMTLDYEN
jgi:ATP-dependent helicase Lhr and Lhr-like helicase